MFLLRKLLISLLLLLLPNNALSATDFVTTYNRTGEDFSTFDTWETAMQGTLADMITGNWDTKVGVLISDNTAVTWDSGASSGTLEHMTENNGGSGGDQFLITVSSGTLDDGDTVTDGVGNSFDVNGTTDIPSIVLEIFDDDGPIDDRIGFLSGITTNASQIVRMTAPVGERHTGKAGTGVVIAYTGAGTSAVMWSQNDYSTFEWLTIDGTNSSSATIGLMYAKSAKNITFRNNIVYNGAADSFVSCITNDPASPTKDIAVYNNIAYNCTGECIDINVNTGSLVYNNTAFNCTDNGVDIRDVSGNVYYNNIAWGNGAADFDDSACGTAICDYNFSEDDSADGANSLNGISGGLTVDFVNTTAGSEDLRLQSTSDAIDQGLDLGPGDFDTDINGRDRDAEGDVWDMGAHEFVAAAGGAEGDGQHNAWNLPAINVPAFR